MNNNYLTRNVNEWKNLETKSIDILFNKKKLN